jgi:hypothetical protein
MGRTACTEPQCLYKDALYLSACTEPHCLYKGALYRTACTEPQCLYKGALYLTFIFIKIRSKPEVKVKINLEEATKAQKSSRYMALIFT